MSRKTAAALRGVSEGKQKEMLVLPLGRRRGNDDDEAARKGLACYIETNRMG